MYEKAEVYRVHQGLCVREGYAEETYSVSQAKEDMRSKLLWLKAKDKHDEEEMEKFHDACRQIEMLKEGGKR